MLAKTLQKQLKISCNIMQWTTAQALQLSYVALPKLKLALSETKQRSAGIDQISPEFLVHLRKSATETLLIAISPTWKTYVPQKWRKADVFPILKKGKPANYRISKTNQPEVFQCSFTIWNTKGRASPWSCKKLCSF